MEKLGKTYRALGFGLLITLAVWGSVFFVTAKQPTKQQTITQENRVLPATTISYKGEEGVDAFTLLKQKVTVEQNRSGLVTSINGRKADDAKKEFWAFYINGEMAQVGPADYVTKEGDRIEWKIETY